MSSANEVKREFEGKLSEANANAKYLYSRVTELEKRSQKLEKKVKKLKKKKKELKEEVAKLRGTTPVQHIADDHDASTSDVELLALSARGKYDHLGFPGTCRWSTRKLREGALAVGKIWLSTTWHDTSRKFMIMIM